jgi:hypothetical protein
MLVPHAIAFFYFRHRTKSRTATQPRQRGLTLRRIASSDLRHSQD